MKVKKLLAGFLSAAMVLGTMSFPVFAANETYTVDAENTLERVMSEINASASGNVVINLDANATFSFGARTQIGNENTESITIDGRNHVLNLIGTDTDWSSLGNAGEKLVFKNVTINKTEGGNGAWNNHAFNITSYVEFDNVTVNNAITIYNGGKFNNTNFYEAGEYYTLYIPAVDQDVVIENCKFEATNAGRGIKVIEQYVSKDEKKPVDITVTGSTFKTAKKAAILVTSTEGANIVASNNNIENVNADTENLVWVDSDLPASYPKVKVTIDGEPVAPYLEEVGTAVAKIGDNYYATLADAMNDLATNGGTLNFLQDIDGSNYTTPVRMTKDAVINSNGYSITDLKMPLVETTGDIDLIFNDVKIDNANILVENGAYANGLGIAAFVCFKDGGTPDIEFNNCEITNSKIIAGEQDEDIRSAGFIGYYNGGNVTVNGGKVENTTIKAVNGVGAITAFTNKPLTVDGTVIKNNTITSIEDRAGKTIIAGSVIGTAQASAMSIKATVSGNKTTQNIGGTQTPVTTIYGRIIDGAELTLEAGSSFDKAPFKDGDAVKLPNGYALDAKDNTVKTLSAVLENNKELTDKEITTIIEDVKVENNEQAAEMVEAIKALDKDVQKEITPEKVEEVINAQGTTTDTDTSAAFSMDDAIIATVEEKTETDDVNVVLKSGNNKVYNITATENNAVVNETSTPVLIKIKTDDIITKVLHEHNGVVKELPFTQANGYVMFTMNESSNVALVSAIPVSNGQAKLSFVPTTSDEGNAKYKLVLTGDTFDTVKNFVSGEFVTSLVGTGSTPFEYVITPENGEIDVYYDTNPDGTRKYHVNLDHFNVDKSYTTQHNSAYPDSVVIGTMTVEGYGAGSIVVSDIQMNKHDGSNENLAKDINTIAGDPAIFNIAVPTRDLKINVNFPNNVNNNAKAYQNMKVEISGGDLAAPITKELGNNVQGVVWNNNTYSVTEKLTYDRSYTVTVSGEGYRTARYTVTMTDNKTLNFWNNVKKQAEVVEVGSDDSKAKNVTFLAGELVRDNQINIYDLSAVVSYFGRTNDVNAESQYAKYDLNRDGKVDSKDVAYVLVSWGK